ncbi:hypothetical protein [Thermococcus sp.]|uniref:hypothetical protein n=1 Tax=Thermococcus sp. TaxID=35749 RepID=UPI002636DF02|nr:hypothetical protein [Thermococcus sp.]
MKRALTALLLLLLFVPHVSATGVHYYPNREAFEAFLSSNSTYTVIPGEDYWSKGWAHYVDSKLGLVKKRGNGVRVLVGNVKDNPEIARLWNRTGLPTSLSFSPSIIVLNGTVIITGTEDNIYLTERAFAGLWSPSANSLAIFGLLFLGVFLLFLASFASSRDHTAKFFTLSGALVFTWLALSKPSPIPDSFGPLFLRGLEVWAGAGPETPLEAFLGKAFSLVPPVEENLWFAHWVLIITATGLFFYTAPKRERELGFIAFGSAFTAPLLRDAISSLDVSALAVTALLTVLAIAVNSAFSPESGSFHILLMAIATLFASIFNPLFLLLPLVFVATFPKRMKRNALYLLLVILGAVALAEQFPLWLGLPQVGFPALEFAKESALPLLVVAYLSTGWKKGFRMKGPTAFLTLLSVVFIILTSAGLCGAHYAYLFLALLVPRAIHSLS